MENLLRKNSDDTWAEKGSPTYQVNHGDCPSGPIDRDGVEVEEAGKGDRMFKCFEGKGK